MAIFYNIKNFFANMRHNKVVPEQLTNEALKRLFGPYWRQEVCVYDCEARTLMASYYNSEKVTWRNNEEAKARKIKKYFEKEFPKFEVVAQVTKQVAYKSWPGGGGFRITTIGREEVSKKDYPSWGSFMIHTMFGLKKVYKAIYPGRFEWSKGEISFDKDGTALVGTLVLRDMETGKLLRVNGSAWFGVYLYLSICSDFVARDSAFWLTYCLDRYSDFREKFFAPFAEYVQTSKAARTR